ncbi:hypothetical protein SLS60_006497 [Paraconiothyrium brasiliense]|uniref:Phage shock protein B n=1 Tax=Paraconiothyrium brasiliense TaxID=300254 RepID=A0ABR3RB37_9PLEO
MATMTPLEAFVYCTLLVLGCATIVYFNRKGPNNVKEPLAAEEERVFVRIVQLVKELNEEEKSAEPKLTDAQLNAKLRELDASMERYKVVVQEITAGASKSREE